MVTSSPLPLVISFNNPRSCTVTIKPLGLQEISFRDTIRQIFERIEPRTDGGFGAFIYLADPSKLSLTHHVVLNMKDVKSISRAAMDEILCQKDRLGPLMSVSLRNLHPDLAPLWCVVKKTHKKTLKKEI